MNAHRPIVSLFAVLLWLSGGNSLKGQAYEQVFAWSDLAGPPTKSLIRASDGNYYGTVLDGGNYQNDGAVIRVTPAGQITTLCTFSYLRGDLGYDPRGGLVQGSDGLLYGMNSTGGFFNNGTFFRVSLSGEYKKLSDLSNTTGIHPVAALVQGADGNFYGVATEGGTNNRGTIFKATPSGSVTGLYSFPATGAGDPSSPLFRGADGTFYGVTGLGSAFYSYSPASGYNLIHTFSIAEGQGLSDTHLVQGADGSFYGTASSGGTTDKGTIFKITTAGAVTVLHTFNGTTGENPRAGLCAASDGFFYGVARIGGANNKGTLFRITASGSMTVLKSFNGVDGLEPKSPVVETPEGLMFGTNSSSPAFRPLYRIGANGALTVIGDFGSSDGKGPAGSLVQDASGMLYGTTSDPAGSTVFKMTLAGERTVLHRFTDATGTIPTGPLTFGGDGSLYGVTNSGGVNSRGTIYRITPGGSHSVLYNFSDTGTVNALGGLVLGDDGNFYGTTSQSASRGQLYRITPSGAFSYVSTFASATGANPQDTLIKGPDGNFYGTTYSNGANGGGTIFSVTPAGVFTALYSFSAVTGQEPFAGLWRRSDGTLFGSTYWGGTSDDGVIYKLSPSGVYSVLGNCAAHNGRGPYSPPVGVPDGRLYGTTSESQQGDGTIYKVGANGTVSTYRIFTGGDGRYPKAAFLYASDGNLYGSVSDGGPGGGGAIFRLRFGATPMTSAATEIGSGVATLHGTVNPNGAATDVSFEWGTSPDGVTSASPPTSVSAGNAVVPVTAVLTGLAPSTTYYYRLRADNSQQFLPQRGEVLSFTTSVLEGPTATTVAAEQITSTSAVLRGVASASELIASTFFERGDQPAEEQWIPGSPSTVPPHSSDIRFSAQLLDLKPHTTYTFRAISRDASSTSRGEALTFTTSNTSPEAVNDALHPTDNVVVINVSGNDRDADGDTLTVIGATQGAHGSVVLGPGETSVTYTGGQDFTGNDAFTYTVTDGYGGSSTASVTLLNRPPTVEDITVHPDIGVGGSLSIEVSSYISDPDADEISVTGVSSGTHAAVTKSGFSLTYRPTDSGFDGQDSFVYTVRDRFGLETSGKVYLVNKPPVATDEVEVLDSSFSSLDVLGNDIDPDGDDIVVISVEGATYGSLRSDGKRVTYTPGIDFEGVDSFKYTISDGRGAKSTGTVTVKANYPVLRILATGRAVIDGTSGGEWSQFGVPSLFNHGLSAGWLARFRNAGGTSVGIFSGALDAPVLQLQVGDAASGATGRHVGERFFSGFRQPVFAGTAFAFIGQTGGETVRESQQPGIWVSRDGEVATIAEAGAVAPGTGGLRFTRFDSIAMPSPDVVFFTARFQPYLGLPRVAAEYGLWVWNGDRLSLIFRKGDSLSVNGQDLVVESFRAMSVVKGSAGQGRYDPAMGSLDILIGFTDGTAAVASADSSAKLLLTCTSNDPNRFAERVRAFGMPCSFGAAEGQVGLVTFERSPNDTDALGRSACYDFRTDTIIARKGMGTPGIQGAQFSAFCDPVAGHGIGGRPVAAFIASHSAGEKTPSKGIWIYDPVSDTPLRALARTGAAVPGGDGAVFSSFESLCIVDGRGPAFVARLTSNNSKAPASSRCLCAIDSGGSLQTVISEGDSLLGQTVRRIDVLSGVPGSSGQTRAWADGDPTPSIILRVLLSDGQQSVVAFSLP